MSEVLKEGLIVKGTVTAIKPYGVFVKLDDDHHGLVHISQISNGFVKNINEYVKVNQQVDVKIITIDESSGRISLSIKEASQVQEQNSNVEKYQDRPAKPKVRNTYSTQTEHNGFNTLEDQLKEWIKKSNEQNP